MWRQEHDKDDCKIETINKINGNIIENSSENPEADMCQCSICQEDDLDDFRENTNSVFQKIKNFYLTKTDEKFEKVFRTIFRELYKKYNYDVDDDDECKLYGFPIPLIRYIRETWKFYIKRSNSPTDIDDQEIEIDVLVMWANALEDTVKDIGDQDTLGRILQDKKKELKKDYISEDEFIQLILHFHGNAALYQNINTDMDKKRELKNDYLSEDGFTQSILDFHENSTLDENMAPHEKVLKTMAYADMVKLWPPRLFILLIALWFIFIFSYEVIARELGYRYHIPDFCSMLILNPFRDGEPWRYLTYSWLHSSWTHLFSNLIGLLIFGIPMEFTNRWWRIFLVYHIGVLAGSLVHFLFDPKLFLLGASAGVYALITAHLSTIILNWVEDDAILIRRVHRFSKGRYIKSRRVRVIRVLFVAFYIIFDIIRVNLESSSNTSIVSHVGGASAGLLAAIICLKNRKVDYWETFFQKFVSTLIIILYIAAIVFNWFGATWYPHYFPELQTLSRTQWENCCNFYFIDKCKYQNQTFGQFDYCFDRDTISADMRCCRTAYNVTGTCVNLANSTWPN